MMLSEDYSRDRINLASYLEKATRMQHKPDYHHAFHTPTVSCGVIGAYIGLISELVQ